MVPNTVSGDRPPPAAMSALSLKVNELMAAWLSSPEGASTVDVIIRESVAAASATGNLESLSIGATSAEALGDVASPPMTPPRRQGAGADVRMPSHRFLGVDELDISRANSPANAHAATGAASSSPTASHRAGVGQAPIDIPRSPDNRALPGPGLRPLESMSLRGGSPGNAGGGSSLRGLSPSPGATVGGLPAVPGGAARRASATFDEIKRFFLPNGAVVGLGDGEEEQAALAQVFATRRTGPSPVVRGAATEVDPQRSIRAPQLGKVCTEVFKLPGWTHTLVLKRILSCIGAAETPNVALRHADLKKYYDTALAGRTPNRRLFDLLRDPSRPCLTFDDLLAMARCLLASHEGLRFLTANEFRELYCRTVAARVIYELEQRQLRHVTWAAFDRSDLPQVMRELDDTADVNTVLRYFSYEHFYVLYCRFWELDGDRDNLLSLEDLERYAQGSLCRPALERVMAGYGRRLTSGVPGRMCFEDFVYFCLSEEDKNSLPAKRYWFNVVDVDGDAVLSGHDLEVFFSDQRRRFLELAPEELQYQDMLCQMLDMLTPKLPVNAGVRLADLRECDTAEHFFNMLTNAPKFLLFEQRDPFAEHQLRQGRERTAWDRFARAEYDRMADEHGGQ